jgi:hypothetical protein
MPGNMNWSQLAVLDASNNDFHGPLADALYSLPVLGYLNLANNRCASNACKHNSLVPRTACVACTAAGV